ncbi:hypothetical protein DV738_g263, partial [Chaetothyriales sp. CBS 135597]
MRNNAAAVLRSLAYQLVMKHRDLFGPVASHFDKADEKAPKLLASAASLWVILKTLLQKPELGKVVCVLDGLDECDEDSARLLVAKFRDLFLFGQSSGRLRLLVVSRRISGLEAFPRVSLDPDNNGDIRLFIPASVQRLVGIPGFDGIRKQVENILLEKAQGTFLWVDLVVSELSKKTTAVEVIQTLEEIPPGLDAIHSRILRQIPGNLRRTIAQILLWIAIALRPLTLQELAAAIPIQSSGSISSNQAIRDYVALCGPILEIHDEQVSFAHQSARDYLLQNKADNDSAWEEFRIKDQQQAHAELARTCLNCIEKSDLRKKALDINDASVKQKSPLLNYAVVHWAEHARRASPYLDADLSPSQPFFSKKSDVLTHWWESYRLAKDTQEAADLPLLHIASYFGIEVLAQNVLRNKPSGRFAFLKGGGGGINQKDKSRRTALVVAAGRGHEAIVALLCKEGANVNLKGESGGPALVAASKNGHEGIVKLLLQNSTDAQLKGHYGADAMVEAAAKGHRAIVELLLTHGADINAVEIQMNSDETYYNPLAPPLLAASCSQQEDIVELLIAKGADVNKTTPSGVSPLMQAASEGHEGIVQLLIVKGAKVNAVDRSDRSALSFAARKQHMAVVKLLLANGANVKFATKTCMRYGDEAALQLLKAAGAWDPVPEKA